MRAVECWACGERVEAESERDLTGELGEHMREAHEEEPEKAELRAWIERKGYDTDTRIQNILWIGRLLASAAAATFLLLAAVNPTDATGTNRTVEVLTYCAFAAIAGTGLCVLLVLGRLLSR
jgi:hypothetical protein